MEQWIDEIKIYFDRALNRNFYYGNYDVNSSALFAECKKKGL